MAREVAYSRDALNALRAMPANLAGRIRAKVAQLAEDPASLSANVIRMAGTPVLYRLRVGDWRVVYSDDGLVLAILRVGPRGGIYD